MGNIIEWQPQLLPSGSMTTFLASTLQANCFYPMTKHRCHFCEIHGSSNKWLWLKDSHQLGQNFLATVQESKTLPNQTSFLPSFPGVRLHHGLRALPTYSSPFSFILHGYFLQKISAMSSLVLPSASQRTTKNISILDPMLVLVWILDCSHRAGKKWFLDLNQSGPDSKTHTFSALP